jgi:hypothetical protein
MALKFTVDSSYLPKDPQSCKLGKHGKWVLIQKTKLVIGLPVGRCLHVFSILNLIGLLDHDICFSNDS